MVCAADDVPPVRAVPLRVTLRVPSRFRRTSHWVVPASKTATTGTTLEEGSAETLRAKPTTQDACASMVFETLVRTAAVPAHRRHEPALRPDATTVADGLAPPIAVHLRVTSAVA